jgi:hypothetical protein
LNRAEKERSKKKQVAAEEAKQNREGNSRQSFII